MPMTLEEIATLVKGELRGEPLLEIRGVASAQDAGGTDLAAIEDPRLFERLGDCGAGALLVAPRAADKLDRPGVLVAAPQVALNRVIEAFGLLHDVDPVGIDPTARMHPSAVLGEGCRVGAYAEVGAGARLGPGCVVHSHAIVQGGAAVLGARCVLHPHAVVSGYATLGDDVVVGSHAVIGASGFGFGFTATGPVRLHHIGRVELGDRVEVGPSATVDRGRFGVTRVEEGAKLDAHVHIGHNCSVGARSVLAAQVGIAGSTRMGADCLVGGQVGIAGHIEIGDRAQIAARTGVPSSLPGNEAYLGYWAKPRMTTLRELGALTKLPAALKDWKSLHEEVAALRARSE